MRYKHPFVSLIRASCGGQVQPLRPAVRSKDTPYEKKLGWLRSDHGVIREFAFDDGQGADNIISAEAGPRQQQPCQVLVRVKVTFSPDAYIVSVEDSVRIEYAKRRTN